MPKPYKSIVDQISLLQNRGLSFGDPANAQLYLLKNNYYNVVNCYSKFLEDQKDRYLDKATFEEIIAIHIYDREIKSIFLKDTLIIENYFKSLVSHIFAKHTNNTIYAYFDQTNYEMSYIKDVIDLINDLNSLINAEKSKGNNAIAHYSNVHGDVPIWVLINFMTFGQTIRLFKFCKNNIKYEITHNVNNLINNNMHISTVRLTPKELEMIMDNIKNFRNILAHNNKLFGHKTRYNFPYIPEIHSSKNIQSNAIRKDIYNIFLIMRLFLEDGDYAILNNSIRKRCRTLNNKLASVDSNVVIQSLGFPQDWIDLPAIPQK